MLLSPGTLLPDGEQDLGVRRRKDVLLNHTLTWNTVGKTYRTMSVGRELRGLHHRTVPQLDAALQI